MTNVDNEISNTYSFFMFQLRSRACVVPRMRAAPDSGGGKLRLLAEPVEVRVGWSRRK